MIDTDKYEGHSEGSWEWVIPEWGDDHIHDSEGNLIAQVTNIDEMQMNARLIADAPLLLAEVKRLRDIINHEIVLPRSKQFFMQHYGEDDFEEVWKKWADGIQKKYWMEK
tara:strand:- start:571 stop:900 length:330 start_codon:yes stop_codon:yes gene_type:complete